MSVKETIWGAWTSTHIRTNEYPSFPAGVVSEEAYRRVRSFNIAPVVMRPSLPCGVMGAVTMHSYSFQPGRYQWRPSGELELAPLPRSNKEFSSPPCLGVNEGQLRNLDFYLHVTGKAVPAPSLTGGVRLNRTN